jgi:predicted transcriptional regulator
MSNARAPIPTDAELALLRVLWAKGPSTVREVHAHIDDSGYTTVLKQLQIMRDKGLVSRDESSRAHVYAAAVQQDETERKLVDDLLDRAFGGSAQRLVMRALSGDRVSSDEIGAIRDLLDSITDDNPSSDGDTPHE